MSGAGQGALQPPGWVHRIRPTFDTDVPQWWREFAPPEHAHRRSAVMILFGARAHGGTGSGERDPDGVARVGGPRRLTDAGDVDVVLTERTSHLRSHAGQVSFPGGRIDPEDHDDPVAAALRETREEVGIEAADIDVVDQLEPLYLHPSQNAVTPVIGWWRRPRPLEVVNHDEVARVARAHIEDLRDPANRFTVVGPGGYRGPGFDVEDLFVWGFTAKLLDEVIDLAGLTEPWDEGREVPIPQEQLRRLMGPR